MKVLSWGIIHIFFYDMTDEIYSVEVFSISLTYINKKNYRKTLRKIILFSKEFHYCYIQSRTNL